MDITQHFDLKARTALSRALNNSQSRGNREVTPLDVMASVMELHDSNVEVIFLAAAISSQETEKKLRRALFASRDSKEPEQSVEVEESEFSAATKEILRESLSLSSTRHAGQVSVEDLFLSIVTHREVEAILPQLGIDSRALSQTGWELLNLPRSSDSNDKQLLKDLRLQVTQVMKSLGEVQVKLARLENLCSGSDAGP